jgi:hypothetical protein
MIKSITVKRDVEVEIPMLPNFLMQGKMPISEFSKDELSRIADAWKQNLLEKAANS